MAGDSESTSELPSNIFIPIFVLLGVSILCAAASLYLYARRRSPRKFLGPSVAKTALRPSTPVVEKKASATTLLSLPKRNVFTSKGVKGMGPSSELQYNLPLNIHDIPSSPTGPDSSSLRRPARPPTSRSSISETFYRKSVRYLSGTSKSTTAYWNRQMEGLGIESRPHTPALPTQRTQRTKGPGWDAPNSWAVVPPPSTADGLAIHVPAVPMPAFLQAPAIMDPRDVDPATFPLPRPLGPSPSKSTRWSASQQSSASGTALGRSSSVGADSVFCTCDLDDIDEESSSWTPGHREGGGRLSAGSSVQMQVGKCPACTRRSQSAAASPPALSVGHPSAQIAAAFSRHSSVKAVRKPRRAKRFQEQRRNNRTVVAGRLYQESDAGTAD